MAIKKVKAEELHVGDLLVLKSGAKRILSIEYVAAAEAMDIQVEGGSVGLRPDTEVKIDV